MNRSDSSDDSNGIAIIGISLRFPDAQNIDQFWQNLIDGVESISIFSDEELKSSGINADILADPNLIKKGFVLNNIDLFDASFFGFNPREAEILDPQHRFFLECSWEALENGGYDPASYKGAIGVYAGAYISTYLFGLYSHRYLVESMGNFMLRHGNDKDYLATRVSYKLNLKGPSVSVQTSCSTAMVAIHAACQSLLNGECDMALAGGVSISVPEKTGYLYQEGGIFSPDGHCRAFDANAKGTVFGNGVGVVVLKRLKDALADRDHIYAVIKASAINNDGSDKVGYTAPSADGQANVIAEAQVLAGVEPADISYVETHGTGTPLGDPIEIDALTRVFRARTERCGFCGIGSVKTNVGHLGTAAGIAGLIKTALALKHKLIPPSLHFDQPNPHIDFEKSPFYVNTKLLPWETDRLPRRAGVSSFGMGGTNAHVILEEPPPSSDAQQSEAFSLLLLSAKTTSSLKASTINLVEHLRSRPNQRLADVAYTLQVGRRGFNQRRMTVCSSREDAMAALSSLDPKRVFTAATTGSGGPLVYMFPGQGSQYASMGSELYDGEPAFREQVDLCAELLKDDLKMDIRSALYPCQKETETAVSALEQTSLAQPALFVIEYALARLWMHWGLNPQAMIGHSLGEYVAACLAGVFTLPDALALVTGRGHLMQSLPSGMMLAVPLREEKLQVLLHDGLALAATNGQSLCVVSGTVDAVKQLERRLAKEDILSHRLHTTRAFHSEMVEPILKPFTELIKKIKLSAPQLPYISNVSGTWITAAEATDPDYWAKHLRQTVRFAEGINELMRSGYSAFLEVGPGRTLCTLVDEQLKASGGGLLLTTLRRPNEQQSDLAIVLSSLGRLWLAGLEVNWPNVHSGKERRRVPLPTYSFERQRYWIKPQPLNSPIGTLSAEASRVRNSADLIYIPSWKQSAQGRRLSKHFGGMKCNTGWLVFGDTSSLSTRLIERLKTEGQNVVTVMQGQHFTKHNDYQYSINPERREDYDELLKELRLQNNVPQIIFHLWNLALADTDHSKDGTCDRTLQRGVYSLLCLAQALGVSVVDPLNLIVISDGIYDVLGEEELSPEKATILGPCLVIPQEYSHISCRIVDISLPSFSREDDVVDRLLAEAILKLPPESVVAYRGAKRWIRTFEPASMDDCPDRQCSLRTKGVYLIFGGWKGIGKILSECLARTVKANLILIEHSNGQAKDECTQKLAAHQGSDAESERTRHLQGLRELGAEVDTICSNLDDIQEVQELFAYLRQKFTQINGVIYAAPISSAKLIRSEAPEIVASMLTSRARTIRLLYDLLGNFQPDFLLFCSTMTSFSGGPGQVGASAESALLDAFARCKADKGPITTINWGVGQWEDWQDSLISIAPNSADLIKEMKESHGITRREASEVLTHLLHIMSPQVIVAPSLDLAMKDQHALTACIPKDSKTVSQVEYTRFEDETQHVSPRNETERSIIDLWRTILGIERISIHDDFFEVGGNSLLALQLVSRLRQHFDVELPLRSLFESATVAKLATLITETQHDHEELDELDELLGEIESLSPEQLQQELSNGKGL